MEKIINFFKSKTVIDIIFLIFLVIIFTFLFGFSIDGIFSDKGREFVFPLLINEGFAPYKDFVTIYFPLSYYINALAYKILGVSINSIVIFQTFFCMLFISFYYLTAREFINRKTSMIVSVFVLSSCVFNVIDPFGYIVPYCYGRVNGLISCIICLYGIIKLYKTDNIKYAYLSAIAVGFAVSNKIEFISFILFFILGLIIYKKLKINQYFKILFFFLIFPIITIGLLFLSGIKVNDIVNAIDFSIKFSSTPGMQYFYIVMGLVPSLDIFYTDALKCFKALLEKGIILFFGILNCYFNKKYLFPVFLIISIASLFLLFNKTDNPYFDLNLPHYWDYTAFFIVILSMIFYKEIFKDKTTLFLLMAAFLIGYREIFKTHIWGQGSFSLPIMFLFIVVIFENFVSKYFSKEKIIKIINFFFIVLICIHLMQQYNLKIKFYVPLKTNKGTIYMSADKKEVMNNTFKYIEENIPKDLKIITLPEGIIINYLIDRKTDNKCFMLDRVYHDAYGEEKAYEIIKESNSDYIILIKGFDLFDFGYEYLYNENASLSANYIYDNYAKVFSSFGADNTSNISIYKKKNEK